jgi:hypothetical protein
LRQSWRLLDDAAQLEQLSRHLASGREAEISLVVDAASPSELLMQALRALAPLSNGTRVQLGYPAISTIGQNSGSGWLPRHQISGKLASGALQPLNMTQGQRYSTNLYRCRGMRNTPARPATRWRNG